jgi:CRISPR-associated protein Csm3
MASDITLLNTHRIAAALVLRSGLHIGAGKDTIEIGGLDSPVVKNPFTREPYIPGSSIKGKLRSLLEWTLNCIETDEPIKGRVWGSDSRGFETGKYTQNDPILRIFGTIHRKWAAGPTRLIVRDAQLDHSWRQAISERGLGLTEEKAEVSIDRIQGKARDGGIRRSERVPAGAQFKLEMIFKVFAVDGDGGEVDRACLNRLLEGLKLLERDALGGSGSRGYGRIRVQGLAVDDVNLQERFDQIVHIDPQVPAQLLGI